MNDKSLNILIIASWYPDTTNPTNGSFVEEQVHMLINRGHNVIVLHPYLKGTFLSSFLKKDFSICEVYNTAKTVRVSVSPVFPGQRKLAYKKLYKKCYTVLNQFNISISDFDIIHSHSLFMGGYIASRIADKFNLPHVHTEHTSGLIFDPSQYNKDDKKIIKTVYNTADKVCFVSEFAKKNILEQWNILSKDKHIVLHNLVSSLFFNASCDKENEQFKFLIIGGLIPRKNHKYLLKALRIYLEKSPKCMLTIAGEGALKDDLIIWIKDNNLEKNINWLPKLNRNEIFKVICKHDCILSVSLAETFGLTVAEAQAIGKPVIVTDSGGVRDIVSPQTGIITTYDTLEFANAMLDVRTNYEVFNSDIIRSKAKEKFSEDVIYSKLYMIYKEVL